MLIMSPDAFKRAMQTESQDQQNLFSFLTETP